MNVKPTIKAEKMQKGLTNWDKVRRLTEKQIASSARRDKDAPLCTRAELKLFRRVHPPKSVNVRHTREKLHLTQLELATYFGVSARTIQEWEQGRRAPTSPARNFLKVIEREPRAVQRALRAH